MGMQLSWLERRTVNPCLSWVRIPPSPPISWIFVICVLSPKKMKITRGFSIPFLVNISGCNMGDWRNWQTRMTQDHMPSVRVRVPYPPPIGMILPRPRVSTYCFPKGAARTTAPDMGSQLQLGEHLPCKQGVTGSNPVGSTIDLGFSQHSTRVFK